MVIVEEGGVDLILMKVVINTCIAVQSCRSSSARSSVTSSNDAQAKRGVKMSCDRLAAEARKVMAEAVESSEQARAGTLDIPASSALFRMRMKVRSPYMATSYAETAWPAPVLNYTWLQQAV